MHWLIPYVTSIIPACDDVQLAHRSYSVSAMSFRLRGLSVPIAGYVGQPVTRLQTLVNSLVIATQLCVDECHGFTHGFVLYKWCGAVQISWFLAHGQRLIEWVNDLHTFVSL